uniref:Uncharacterized protein n=1 Tax=Trichogramma kaykai TaxID=54128 RepID=A0ABD2W5L5_9HYME
MARISKREDKRQQIEKQSRTYMHNDFGAQSHSAARRVYVSKTRLVEHSRSAGIFTSTNQHGHNISASRSAAARMRMSEQKNTVNNNAPERIAEYYCIIVGTGLLHCKIF